ncbi:MAG TPA: response regulator transcription factor [Prolixibacteraceae bacterium]|jgi:DNA-binding NarL/FixJ family response regulator
METEKIKILLADDHSVVRNGLIRSLSSCFPNAEFGEAGNAMEVLQIIKQANWNLVILDINMPGRSGMEVLKDIKANYPSIPVIIFSMYPEDQFAIRAMKAGASAYLTKDISSKELEKAIKGILNGERYFTPSIAELLTNEIRENKSKKTHQLLSDREHQVFLLIASGKNVSDIARDLLLSVKTISVYRSIILKKMSLKNNSEITHYAFKHNLVE